MFTETEITKIIFLCVILLQTIIKEYASYKNNSIHTFNKVD